MRQGNLRRVMPAIALTCITVTIVWAVVEVPFREYPVLDDQALDVAKLTPAERLQLTTSREQMQAGLRTSLIQTLAGIAVLGGAILAWLQFAHTRAESVRQAEYKREDFHLDLFAESLKSLAGSTADVRIGGMYALARLAELSIAHRPACADTLSAFVRTRSTWPPKPPRPAEAEMLDANTGKSLRDFAPDVQVALTLLGRHTHRWWQLDYLRLRHLDLRKSNLSRGHFERVAFTESQLQGSWLTDVNFKGASFRGASLANAELKGSNMDKCNIRDADFTGTSLEDVTFRGAVFDKRTRWPSGFSADEARARGATLVPVDAPATSARGVDIEEL